MIFIKIRSYKISKRGHRGLSITVPQAWAEDVGVGAGDVVDFFRDDKNHLILQPRQIKPQHFLNQENEGE